VAHASSAHSGVLAERRRGALDMPGHDALRRAHARMPLCWRRGLPLVSSS
jgi:hypothetical protein